MREKTAGFWQWVSVGLIGIATLIAAAVRLNHDDPDTWGTDFWQRVIVSILGTLGALLIGVGLYYLKRWHDKKDADEERHRTEQDRLHQELVACIREGLELPSTDYQKVAKPGSLTLMCSIYGARFFQYQQLIEDGELKRLSAACNQALFNLSDNPTAPSDDRVADFAGVFTQATMLVTKYLSEGTPIQLDNLKKFGQAKQGKASKEGARRGTDLEAAG